MTKREKVELIKSYTEDYHKVTGEYIRLYPCSNWEAMASFIEKVEYWKLVRVISDLTGWRKSMTFSRSKRSEYTLRRGIVDFIAINNGCTYTQCARLTDRDHTTVMNSVRSFENRLETEIQIRIFFKEIMEYVKENYHIYENQVVNEDSLT